MKLFVITVFILLFVILIREQDTLKQGLKLRHLRESGLEKYRKNKAKILRQLEDTYFLSKKLETAFKTFLC